MLVRGTPGPRCFHFRRGRLFDSPELSAHLTMEGRRARALHVPCGAGQSQDRGSVKHGVYGAWGLAHSSTGQVGADGIQQETWNGLAFLYSLPGHPVTHQWGDSGDLPGLPEDT